MTWSAFAFLMTGVLLNAAAQLLLKAGTNALGVITLDAATTGATRSGAWRTQGHFVAGVACYVVSLVVWIMALSRVPVSRRLSDAVDRLRGQRGRPRTTCSARR